MEQTEQVEHIDNELIKTDKIISYLNKNFIFNALIFSYTIIYQK